MAAARRIERLARRVDVLRVPQLVPDEPGLVTVDATWGTISPMRIAPGVLTVGELEVIEHIDAGLPLVDTRLAHFYRHGTIPGARNVPHEHIEESIDSLEPNLATIFFCSVGELSLHTRLRRCAQAPELSGLFEVSSPRRAARIRRDWARSGGVWAAESFAAQTNMGNLPVFAASVSRSRMRSPRCPPRPHSSREIAVQGRGTQARYGHPRWATLQHRLDSAQHRALALKGQRRRVRCLGRSGRDRASPIESASEGA
jgi:hypothetical protein